MAGYPCVQFQILNVGVLVNTCGCASPARLADPGGFPGVQVETLEVGVLVNNVGMSYPHAEYYDAIDEQLIDDLITMNIVSTNKARCGVYSLSDITARCCTLYM